MKIYGEEHYMIYSATDVNLTCACTSGNTSGIEDWFPKVVTAKKWSKEFVANQTW